MNKYLVVVMITVIITMIFSISLLADQTVNAKTLKKIQFTQTLTSTQDPGQGHEGHQLALILSPSKGALYHGAITYTASEPVQIVILHEINKEDSKGQPTWTVDGDTIFGLTLVDLGNNSGSYEFTGAALALHSKNTNKFTTTVSIDGWIRGQTPEFMEKRDTTILEPTLKLSRSSVSAEIPMHRGLFEAKPVYYIITDTNDKAFAKTISQKQKWKVELAPPLSKVSKGSLNDVFIFLNGIKGNGTTGFQDEVFSNTPEQTTQYSAFNSVTHITWKKGEKPEILDSVKKILDAEKEGKIELEKTDFIVNMPQITWPGGQMTVRTEKILNDDTEFIGGQVLEINMKKSTVTLIGHRGWGPDGRTVYYVVTGASPSGLADLLGVTNIPTLEKTFTTSSGVNLYQFTSGIKGSGPTGFQAGIVTSALGDETYNPQCKISSITWNEQAKPSVLETISDIEAKKSAGDIIIDEPKFTDGFHILNCPFIDPFQ